MLNILYINFNEDEIIIILLGHFWTIKLTFTFKHVKLHSFCNICYTVLFNTQLLYIMSYSLLPFTCVALFIPGCPNPPGISNTRLISSGPYGEGSVARYQCEGCFSGSPQTTCRSGRWDPPQPQPQCSRKYGDAAKAG